MDTKKLNSLVGQRGSFYSSLMMLIMIGVFAICALKIVPTYIDNNLLVSAMDDMIANHGIQTMTLGDIRKELMKNLLTNNIREFNAQNIVLVRDNNMDYIDINYEARVHLFSNIDAIVVFKNRFNKF